VPHDAKGTSLLSTTLLPVTAAPRRSVAASVLKGAVALNVTALLLVSVAMRWIDLDWLPGINGDEAWYGVLVERILQGESVPLRTPTGNLINPFYLGPLLLAHIWLAPSGFALRVVAAFTGTLALAANFWFCRKSLGQTAAVISTVLLAIFPINIAYSRFGWDASQSLLATLLVVHCSLLSVGRPVHRVKWLTLAGIALAAAVIVHPTNVFIAIVPASVVFQCQAAIRVFYARTWRSVRARNRAYLFLVGAVALAGLLSITTLAPASFRLRLTSSEQALAFVIQLGRLFSGATVYRYISGSIPADPPGDLPGLESLQFSDAVAWLLAGLAIYGVWRWRRRATESDFVLCVATPLTVLAFYVVAGPQAISPHLERYALCLVAPVVLLLSRGAAWWLTLAHDRSHRGKLAAAATAWLILASFYSNYFGYVRSTGGDSHVAFRTSASEPKAAALEYVLNNRYDRQNLTIVAGEWWNYWPLAYLASRRGDIEVVWSRDLSEQTADRLLAAHRLWQIEFSGSTAAREASKRFEPRRGAERKSLNDPLGRPILTIYGPAEDSSQKY
jgi:4-amino-4-deoxy-L-arabinose transferase-like glycosyltransferase